MLDVTTDRERKFKSASDTFHGKVCGDVPDVNEEPCANPSRPIHSEAEVAEPSTLVQFMPCEGSMKFKATMPLAEGPRPAETTLGLPMPANRLPRPMVEERDTPSGDGREPMIERKDLLRRKGGPTDSARLRLRNDRPTQHSLTHAFKMPEI